MGYERPQRPIDVRYGTGNDNIRADTLDLASTIDINDADIENLTVSSSATIAEANIPIIISTGANQIDSNTSTGTFAGEAFTSTGTSDFVTLNSTGTITGQTITSTNAINSLNFTSTGTSTLYDISSTGTATLITVTSTGTIEAYGTRVTVAATTGAAGTGGTLSTALAAKGYYALTSTSTTGSTGASIWWLDNPTAGDGVYFAVKAVAGSSSPFRIYCSTDNNFWDSTSLVVDLSTVGTSLYIRAMSSSAWMLMGGDGYALGSST